MSLNILVMPDKFKGTLAAQAAAEAIARGWSRARPDDRITLLPISDGGDGFGEVISGLLGAKARTLKTVDAAHRPCKARWWWQSKTRTAVIESANIIGLAMLQARNFHPFRLDTFGLGKAVRSVVKKGARRIIIGIGGSATNDGGFGMARALGWKFINRDGDLIRQWTALFRLGIIRPPKTQLFGRDVEIVVAVDVQNPLLGPRGATRIYGLQKGLRPRDFTLAERCLRRLAQVCNDRGLRPPLSMRRSQITATTPGSGAAGGLGFGLMTFTGARLENGFGLLGRLSELSKKLRSADLVITGEGRIDESSLMGKGIGEIATNCRKMNIPCVALAGTTVRSRKLNRQFKTIYALTDLTSSERAMRNSANWLEKLAKRAASEM
jgi:glycerate 2-kinase